MKLKNRIMHKTRGNCKLTEREIAVNKVISKVHYKVEKTVGVDAEVVRRRFREECWVDQDSCVAC